jgi:hypothetical protein
MIFGGFKNIFDYMMKISQNEERLFLNELIVWTYVAFVLTFQQEQIYNMILVFMGNRSNFNSPHTHDVMKDSKDVYKGLYTKDVFWL